LNFKKIPHFTIAMAFLVENAIDWNDSGKVHPNDCIFYKKGHCDCKMGYFLEVQAVFYRSPATGWEAESVVVFDLSINTIMKEIKQLKTSVGRHSTVDVEAVPAKYFNDSGVKRRGGK
jgi:hypothetical protein